MDIKIKRHLQSNLISESDAGSIPTLFHAIESTMLCAFSNSCMYTDTYAANCGLAHQIAPCKMHISQA